MSPSMITPTFEERLFLEHWCSEDDLGKVLGGSVLHVFVEVSDSADLEITGVSDFSTDAPW